jgi:hypothetical protein
MYKIDTNSIYWSRYTKFINTRQTRIIPTNSIVELHHIVPKCAGGDDSISNLIELTVREHFIAHWMLSKVGIDDVWYKLRFAFGCMSVYSKSNSYRNFLTSRQFEISKKIRKETFKMWNDLNPSKAKGTSWYVDEDGVRYRCHPDSPKIKEFNLKMQAPGKGKKWYTDGNKFFMLFETDPVILSLNLQPGCPIKGVEKQYSVETLKSLSEDRAERFWFNDGKQSYKLKLDDVKIKELGLSVGRLISPDGLERIKSGAAWKRTLEDNLKNSLRQQSKMRFNDGVRNFTLDPDDPLISQLSLIPGVILTEEGRKKISLCAKNKDTSYIVGKKWFNDGIKNYRLFEDEGLKVGLVMGKLSVSKPKGL